MQPLSPRRSSLPPAVTDTLFAHRLLDPQLYRVHQPAPSPPEGAENLPTTSTVSEASTALLTKVDLSRVLPPPASVDCSSQLEDEILAVLAAYYSLPPSSSLPLSPSSPLLPHHPSLTPLSSVSLLASPSPSLVLQHLTPILPDSSPLHSLLRSNWLSFLTPPSASSCSPYSVDSSLRFFFLQLLLMLENVHSSGGVFCVNYTHASSFTPLHPMSLTLTSTNLLQASLPLLQRSAPPSSAPPPSVPRPPLHRCVRAQASGRSLWKTFCDGRGGEEGVRV